jgi:hypothetical protein
LGQRRVIAYRHADEQQETRADLADGLVVDADRCPGHAL